MPKSLKRSRNNFGSPRMTDNSQFGTLFTIPEAAARLQVSVVTMRRWVRKGAIGHVLIGPYRIVRIPEQELKKQIRAIPGAKS